MFAGKTLAHPLRIRLLDLFEDEHSPNEVAAILGEPLQNVSYHVRELHVAGVLELTRTAQRRGAIEHYYVRVVTPWELFKKTMQEARGT